VGDVAVPAVETVTGVVTTGYWYWVAEGVDVVNPG